MEEEMEKVDIGDQGRKESLMMIDKVSHEDDLPYITAILVFIIGGFISGLISPPKVLSFERSFPINPASIDDFTSVFLSVRLLNPNSAFTQYVIRFLRGNSTAMHQSDIFISSKLAFSGKSLENRNQYHVAFPVGGYMSDPIPIFTRRYVTFRNASASLTITGDQSLFTYATLQMKCGSPTKLAIEKWCRASEAVISICCVFALIFFIENSRNAIRTFEQSLTFAVDLSALLLSDPILLLFGSAAPPALILADRILCCFALSIFTFSILCLLPLSWGNPDASYSVRGIFSAIIFVVTTARSVYIESAYIWRPFDQLESVETVLGFLHSLMFMMLCSIIFIDTSMAWKQHKSDDTIKVYVYTAVEWIYSIVFALSVKLFSPSEVGEESDLLPNCFYTVSTALAAALTYCHCPFTVEEDLSYALPGGNEDNDLGLDE